jgi:hypothetical protein
VVEENASFKARAQLAVNPHTLCLMSFGYSSKSGLNLEIGPVAADEADLEQPFVVIS